MSVEIAAIVGLAVMFIIATVLPINMGALAFVGAFVVGLLAHMSAKEIFAGFPGDLFVTLVGITYLFAIAQNNGTIDWLVHRAAWLVRGRIAAIPWVMFTVAGVLTCIGAVSPAAVAIIAPIALRFAHKYGISPLLMGLMVIHGAQAGGFSPMSIYGGITNQVVERAGLPRDDIALFLASLVFNFAVAVSIYFFFGGHRAARRNDQGVRAAAEIDRPGVAVPLRGHDGTPGALQMRAAEDAEPESQHSALDSHRALTLMGLIALGVGSLAFELNVGLVAISVAVLLALLAPNAQKGAVDQVSWSTVLLITGVITYIAVLQKVGAVDLVGTSVSGIGAPLLGALLLCYIGGGVSAFASSVAVLGATIPLAVPFLLQGNVHPVGVVAAIAVSSTIVDVSPFSTNGALVVANAHGVDKDHFYRQMLMYSGLVVAIGPLLAWLVLVLPGWL
ncbi:MAG: SLC13 family permease [Acidobacteriota bacterium]